MTQTTLILCAVITLGLVFLARITRATQNKLRELRSPQQDDMTNPEPVVAPQGSLLFKASLLLLLLFLALTGVVGVRHYTRLSQILSARLLGQPPQRTALYARPHRVWVGQKTTLQALQERLDRIGYRSAESEGPRATDWYQVLENRLRLGHADGRGQVEEFEILFSGKAPPQDRVTGIRAGGKAIPEAHLKPQFLSSLFGSSREKKKYVRFDDLPQGLVNAVLAAEDERFFSHHGLDLWGILRAGLINLRSQEPLQGGSTLTQQFIKNYFLTPEKSYRRKLEEACLALLLETRLSKKEIFELYANEVYLGQMGSFGILGFGQGADAYFGKNVKDLTLEESALLAGIIQTPNRYSPYRHPQEALLRRNYILELMEKKGFISSSEKTAALSAPLRALSPFRQNYTGAPYFVDDVKETLERELGDLSQIPYLEVYTSLDIDLQKAAFEAVQEGLAEVDRLLSRRRRRPSSEPQAALVAVDPGTGEILALVGGRNYATSQYNRATRALRQPGSTFKPFVYAAALQKGLDEYAFFSCTISSLLMDEPYTFHFAQKAYSPGNYGERYYGPVTLRQALTRSLNVPTVKLAQQVGFDSVAIFARQFGFRFGEPLLPYPSMALGTFEVTLLELAQAYAVLANGGVATPLRAVTAVKRDGAFREPPADPARPTLRPEVAFLITSALESVLSEGTGASARARGFHLPAAGKTGTSDDDSWFVGYTPDLLCAVWVGLDDSSPLHLTGAQGALPIWTLFMTKAQRLGHLSGAAFSPPENIVAVSIDAQTGLLASDRCEEIRAEFYVRGTEPARVCSHYDEAHLTNLLLEPGAKETPREKKGGFWGWLKRIFR
ncbi:PBP1A family penicillin-binding protein [bacterium]|nr:PBP1A family penicillin-binding protein [bacterium]